MRKLLTAFIISMCFTFTAKAQFVNIPDSSFRSYLKLLFPSCFNSAGEMDTSCIDILNVTSLNCSSRNIKDLVGISYFKNLQTLHCYNNQLASLPNLPTSLQNLSCYNNKLTSLPKLPNSLQYLNCRNNNIFCLPRLSNGLVLLDFDGKKINCLPNYLPTCTYYTYDSTRTWSIKNVCNATNNKNQCQAFPTVQSFVYTDLNNNNKLDTNEFAKHNLKISLFNKNYAYTNTNGIAFLYADSLGSYAITAQAPSFYNAVPSSYTHTSSNYDTIVYDTFALRPSQLKDSIVIKLTPINWAARAGRAYPYLVQYENMGTTLLSNAFVSLQYDNSLLNYDSSSVSGVANSGSSLSLNVGNVLPGQTGNFIAYFKVATTAVFNSIFTSIANITTNTVNSVDTVKTTVRGSYDPNDKQATPTLTPQQVTDGTDIDYTIRFQNTGTDTAFNVVIADTLDSKLQTNQLQMVGSSHPCRTTVKDNIIFFEFLDIMLPDSNANKLGSNGFVSFKIKPISTVTNGTTIPNKAAIYFDYNTPVITKPATTIIQNPLPLQLLNFSAIAQNELNKVLVYWNTANEVNTAYFIIETSSNVSNFKAVAELAAKGVGSNSYFYSIDKTNVVYVRLKMVDKNGHYSYSNIIKLAMSNEQLAINISPNPAKGILNITVYSTKLNNTAAKIVNAKGQIIKTFILTQGYTTIDISGIAAGVYYLHSNEGSKKVLVE